MNNLNTITISVDSSFKDGRGAVAYYIKHEQFVVKDSEFLGEVESSTECELQGMVKAVNRMVSELRNKQILRVYITCDCKYALDNIRSNCEALNQFPEVITQHIDAHSGTRSPRQYINDWCDRESRRCLIDNLT